MNHLALLIFLALAQTPPETRDALTIAITTGNVQSVKDELAHGSNWKSKNKDGIPALILAADSGQDAIVRLMLNDPEQKSVFALGTPLTDKQHRTALTAAAASGHRSTVLELLAIASEGLSSKVRPIVRRSAGDPGFDPAQEAIGGLIAATMARSVLLNTPDENAVTALMFASQRGWQDVADSLVNAGADAQLRDKNGMTASVYAENAGHASLAASLRLA